MTIRLIRTANLYLKTFAWDIPKYAILSHKWASDDADEVSYQQLCAGSNLESHGYRKISHACALARQADLEWLWVDTCCIDKTSSAELSEAINSMFVWYRDAAVCFAFCTATDRSYMDRPPDHIRAEWTHEWAEQAEYGQVSSAFSNSWFGRGWILQELITPQEMSFFEVERMSEDLPAFLGTKVSLASQLSRTTGIEEDYLCGHTPFKAASVAKRMYWASRRTSTRIEDMAYCLLGLFDVNMALLYGEGTRAFLRLQQTIISQSDDETIFAWTALHPLSCGMLATSSAEFWRYPCLKQKYWR